MNVRRRSYSAVLNVWYLALLALACIGFSSGCAHLALMPTPNLYRSAEEDPFAEVASSLQSNRVSRQQHIFLAAGMCVQPKPCLAEDWSG
jgi:hypothetical protein